MIHIRAGSPAQKLMTLLSVCGEYPLCALSLLGDARWYRETVRRLTAAETVRIGGENLRGKLLTLNGRGQDRSVRLSSGAIPILTRLGAWDFYRDTQWVHKFPGGAHRDRRLRCGEANGMSMEAGIECRPYRLPNITEAGQSDEPAFYYSTELKRAGGNEIRKLGYSRAVGALLTPDRIHAVYNTRGAVMKWLGRGEVRMRDDLAVLGQGRQAEKNLSAVYRLLTQNGERQLHLLFERLPPEHPARAPYSLFAQAGDTVRSGIILGLGTRLQVLQNPAVRRITERSDMDLTAPGKRKCAYFIILSDQDATMAFLSSLFFSVLFIRLTRFADSCPELRCPIPVNLILDEFNNIGRLGGAADGSDFARSLSVVRSRDIRVMLAVQSLGQLQNRYPDNLWAEILGNCDIQLMLGCTDAVSAQYFSERSGEMSVRVDSTMTVRRTFAPIQMIPQYRKSEGEGKRRLLTPDEVLRLPPRKLLCVIRGQNLLLLEKLDYTKHPLAARLRRVSVHDYAPHPETEQAEAETEKTTSEKTQTGTLYASAKPPESF